MSEIDKRIDNLKNMTIEDELEYANKEHIRLAVLLAKQEKVIADMNRTITVLENRLVD